MLCADYKDEFNITTSNTSKHLDIEKKRLEVLGGSYKFESIDELKGITLDLKDCFALGKNTKSKKTTLTSRRKRLLSNPYLLEKIVI
jgi:hypothetical protein